MTEIIAFTITGIILYVLTNQIVSLIEKKRGELLEQRTIVFFIIFFVLAMLAFQVVPFMFNK